MNFPRTHFSAKTLKVLSAKGITVIGTQAIPDSTGSFLNSDTGYRLDDNGTHHIRMFDQVMEIANA